jgi:hypothetical protein
MISQDAAGEMTRLFPSACSGSGFGDTRILPDRLFQVPSPFDPATGALQVVGTPGMEAVYAIAVTPEHVARNLAVRLEKTQDPCRPDTRLFDLGTHADTRRANERIRHWQSYLDRLAADNPGKVQWLQIPFRHVSYGSALKRQRG